MPLPNFVERSINQSMAGLNRLRQLAGLSPEVVDDRRAAPVPFRHKAAYTVISVLVFLAGSRLPLYGINYRPTTAALDPFYWIHAAGASNCGTLMALGVYPVLISELVIHLLFGQKIVRVKLPEEQCMQLMYALQNLLGVLIAMALAIVNVLSVGQLGTWNAGLIALQLFVGGAIIVYLDQGLKRGYGLVSSGIALFTATNVCASFLWELANGGMHGGGKVPKIVAATGTCAFLALVAGPARLALNLHVALPVRTRRHDDIESSSKMQANCRINLSYLSYAPIFFQGAIVSSAYCISQLLHAKQYGESNRVVNLLGKWKHGTSIPIGGVAYYVTTPPTLVDLARDPVHVILYAFLLLMGCAVFSAAWFVLRVYSKPYVTRLLGKQILVTPAQRGSIPLNRWKDHVAMVALLVGFCVGTLTLLAGFVGVAGSGTGIMLVVTVVYSYFEGRGGNHAGDVFCL